MTLLFIILACVGVLLILAGFLGCVLPILPGPPLAFLGLVALWGGAGWEAETFAGTTVLVLGGAAVLVTALDFITPVWGAKRFGASRAGIWGSVGGMVVGLIWFPPLGSVVGAFVGAHAGESLAGKRGREALRAAWGVFVGTMIGMILKLAVCIAIAYYYVMELIA